MYARRQRGLLAATGLVVLLLPPASAAAQERGQTGVTMGYPAAIGIIYHVSDNVAIRPELSFSRTTTETTSEFGGDTSGWSFGTGASALFYLKRIDAVRTYVSPRVTFSRTSSTVESSIADTSTSKGNAFSVTGSFGAQYTPHRRFAVFGEVGFGLIDSSIETPTTELSSLNWGTRTGFGAILYF
jgi:hypothetical protein